MAGSRMRTMGWIIVRATVVLAWLGGCGEGTGPVLTSDSVIVSNPVSIAAIGGFNASLRSENGNAADDDLVYVALAPGTIPDGQLATVRKVGATNTVTASVLEGGLDPVPVLAQPGDDIEIVVTGSGSAAPVSFRVIVPSRRRPVVVRADPPPRKRDVPLNAGLVLVFNEPVASGSLAGGVRLFHGDTPIPGTAEPLGGTATAAIFRPGVILDANADYRLVATTAVRDLSGDPLEAEVAVEFTTGQTLQDTPNSIVVVPDTSEILIGSQVQLTGSARDSSGNPVQGVPFVWVSDNSSVASVSGAGLVTALAAGVAHISGGEAMVGPGVATVFVVASRAPIASIALTPDSASIPLGPGGGTVRLSAVLRDAVGNVLMFRQVQWRTSDPAIATVAGGSGGRALVRGRATGMVTIVATSEGRADSVTVAVVQPGPYLRVIPGGLNNYNAGHTCGVTADNWVLCWGVNNVGQQGTGVPGLAYSPTGVGGIKFSEVAPSTVRTCALSLQGSAYCWGEAGLGALGMGTTLAPDQCFAPCSEVPAAVVGGHQFISIGVGWEHACALDGSGGAYCWGDNQGGLLGIGSPSGPQDCQAYGRSGPCSPTPVPVTGGLTFTALGVGGAGTGYEHSCALTGDSLAYCWGYNTLGQLGDSTTVDRATPVRAVGGHRFVSLSIGNTHTCGLTSDGTAYCWGANSGALGTGSMTGPEACNWFGSGQQPCSRQPVAVTGGIQWSSISAGGGHTCAVSVGGTGYCWGDNGFGQLGDGTRVGSATPVAIAGGLTFANLSTGNWHSCGVTVAGLAYCWGENPSGELGDGTTTSSLVPVKVVGQP